MLQKGRFSSEPDGSGSGKRPFMHSLDYCHSFLGNYRIQSNSVPSIGLGTRSTTVSKSKAVSCTQIIYDLSEEQY